MTSGYLTEDEIIDTCSHLFLEDFVYSKLNFHKKNKNQKELADLILKLDNNIICFQIKRKNEVKTAKIHTERDINRTKKRITKALNQIKKSFNYLKQGPRKVLNYYGIEQELYISEASKPQGVVILHLIGKELTAFKNQHVRFNKIKDIPTHIFLKEEFEFVAQMNDTLPDFINYLKCREQLFINGNLTDNFKEENLAHLYISQRDIINEALKNPNKLLVAYEGERSCLEVLKDTKAAFQSSYLIDEFIRHQHASIGFTDFSSFSGSNIISQNEKSYITAVTELAKFDREERQGIATQILKCINQSNQSQNDSYGFLRHINNESIFIMTSFLSDRKERAAKLSLYASAIYCHLGLNKLISMATEADWASGISEDIIIFDGLKFENSEEILELMRNWLRNFENQLNKI